VAAPRVAVVGAGVAGSAAAVALARMGCEVHLLESAPEPRAEGAGLLLQPTGLAMLRALGLDEAAVAAGSRVDHLFGDTPSGRVVLDMRYARLGPGSFGVGIQRTALLSLLWQAVRGSGVHWHLGTPLESFEQDSGGVSLQAGGAPGVPSRVDLLVLANGSFSHLREGMQVQQQQRLYPWGALWCLLPLPAGWEGLALRQRYRRAQQMMGVMPVGCGLGTQPLVTMFWSMSDHSLQAWREQPDLTALKEQMQALWPAAAPLLEPLRDAATLRVARYADVWMQQWHDGRAVAIGDCAHGMSPQLGQGANMGLIDALTLADAVGVARRSGRDVAEALASYSARRHSHLRFYQRASRALTPLFQSDAWAGPLLRDLFFGLGGKLPYVERQSVAALAGLKAGWLRGRMDLPQASFLPH
jgi:2-polyprenyl-6-methoxyphenol hydroxylase-like FAD-dependent oxidoreductase